MGKLFLGNQKGDSPTRATLDEPTFSKCPYKTLEIVYTRNKKLAWLETGHRFSDSWVTLQARPTFLHIHVNTLSRLDRSTPSRRDNFCFVKVRLSNQSYLMNINFKKEKSLNVVVTSTTRKSKINSV